LVTEYNKAIRDQIPDIIRSRGLECKVTILNDEEFIVKLEDKLSEELHEYYDSRDIEELADILEVVYRIAELKGIDRNGLETIRKDKKRERGGFKDNLYLIETSK